MIIIFFKWIHSWCHFSSLSNSSDMIVPSLFRRHPPNSVIFMWQSVVMSALIYSRQIFLSTLYFFQTGGVTVSSAICNTQYYVNQSSYFGVRKKWVHLTSFQHESHLLSWSHSAGSNAMQCTIVYTQTIAHFYLLVFQCSFFNIQRHQTGLGWYQAFLLKIQQLKIGLSQDLFRLSVPRKFFFGNTVHFLK